jgi:hypothetical protein
MKLFQVTVHRIRVGIVAAKSEEELESTNPDEVWEKLKTTARLIQEATEVVDIADATSVCTTCLSPLEVTAKANLVLVPGESFTVSSTSDVSVRCVSDPDHPVPEDQVRLLVKELCETK